MNEFQPRKGTAEDTHENRRLLHFVVSVSTTDNKFQALDQITKATGSNIGKLLNRGEEAVRRSTSRYNDFTESCLRPASRR